MNNKRKVRLISIFFFISILAHANHPDSLDTLIKNQMRTLDSLTSKIEIIEKEIFNLQSVFRKPIEIVSDKNILEVVSEVFIIVISILTLFYVVKADKINELYGSYLGRKKYFNLQREIAEFSIKLKNVKKEFQDFMNISPDDFVINGIRNISKLKNLTNEIENSPYFTYPGDIIGDRQELIYETRPDDKIVYRFNNYVESRISHCRQLIDDIERDISKKIEEAESIKLGS